MKNQILISAILALTLSCNNASDKIDNNSKTNTTNTQKPTTNNEINAQIIDNSGGAAFEFTNQGGTVWDFGNIVQGDSPENSFFGKWPYYILIFEIACDCFITIK